MGIGHEAQIVKLETLLQIRRRKLARSVCGWMLDYMLIGHLLLIVRHAVGLVVVWLIKSVLGARHI